MMSQTQSIAKKLDIFFQIIQIVVRIAFVGYLIGLAIIGAGVLFQLNPEMIGTGYASLELGFMEFDLAESAAPKPQQVLLIVAVNMLMMLPVIAGAEIGIKQIREILTVMKEGQPFHMSISKNLKKLAVLCLGLGIVINVISIVNLILISNTFHITELFISKTITHVTVNFDVDFTFLAISAVLLLLSYVFQYGEELQTLSDETL